MLILFKNNKRIGEINFDEKTESFEINIISPLYKKLLNSENKNELPNFLKLEKRSFSRGNYIEKYNLENLSENLQNWKVLNILMTEKRHINSIFLKRVK